MNRIELLLGFCRSEEMTFGKYILDVRDLISNELFENVCVEFADFIVWDQIPNVHLSSDFVKEHFNRAPFAFAMFSIVDDLTLLDNQLLIELNAGTE